MSSIWSSLQIPWNHIFSDHILPSLVKRPGKKVPLLSQGVSESPVVWNRLVPSSTSGVTWSPECSKIGLCCLLLWSSFWYSVGFSWWVHQSTSEKFSQFLRIILQFSLITPLFQPWNQIRFRPVYPPVHMFSSEGINQNFHFLCCTEDLIWFSPGLQSISSFR